jgi:hypothetical protein
MHGPAKKIIDIELKGWRLHQNSKGTPPWKSARETTIRLSEFEGVGVPCEF